MYIARPVDLVDGRAVYNDNSNDNSNDKTNDNCNDTTNDNDDVDFNEEDEHECKVASQIIPIFILNFAIVECTMLFII